MIGLVVVAHAPLAEAFVSAAVHVLGPQEALEAISILPGEPRDRSLARIRDAAARVDRGAGVLFLTDLVGGTPSNLAGLIRDELTRDEGRAGTESAPRADLIAGINLPLLIKLLGLRTTFPLTVARDRAIEAGHKYLQPGAEPS